MGTSTKTPDCKCVACERFRMDTPAVWEAFRCIEKYLSESDAAEMHRMCESSKGCDLCGRDALRVPFVPQVIQSFFRIEHLCEWCRNRIDYRRRELKWPVCWGSTSDDELKWFLLHDALARFNEEVRRLSPAQIEKDATFKEWLDSLPVEETPAPELKIRIKRRVTTDVSA